MLIAYRIFSTLAYPLLMGWLKWRQTQGKEHKTRLAERFGYASVPRPHAKLIWMHAASVGESNSLIPLMEALAVGYPELIILLTTGTTSSAITITSRLPENAIHQFVPIDSPLAVQRFLKHWQPDGAIWVESDLWPNLILAAKKRRIPMFLVNARMSERSAARWQNARAFFQELMSAFHALYAGSADDARIFRQLGVSAIDYKGNLKYDAPRLPADPTAGALLQNALQERPIWLAASTHAGEEMMVGEAHRHLKRLFPELLTLLVPRHATRGDEVHALLLQQELNVARRSKNERIKPDTDIYLGDTMGELGIFYRLSPVAFIGGSLIPHGGHNPIEPAQLGCAVICGPYMDSFRGICREMKDEGALIQVVSVPELISTIEELLRNKEARMRMAERAAAAIAEHGGVVATLLQMIGQSLQLGIPNVRPDKLR